MSITNPDKGGNMMKKTAIRLLSVLFAVALTVCMLSGVMLSVFAEEEPAADGTAKYASTDYANKSELFDALMAEVGSAATVDVPIAEGYDESITERMKYIVNADLIGESYSDKEFIFHFCGVDLAVDGSYLKAVGGKRVEIQIEKIEPIALYYTCPKCEAAGKKPYEGALDSYEVVEEGVSYVCPRCKEQFALTEAGEPSHNEVVKGAITLIEEKKHHVVGTYVYQLKMYSDGRAVSEYGTKDSGITATVKPGAKAVDAAKSENSKAIFSVYAYLAKEGIYDNMEATVDEAAGTATFTVKDRGWFYLAADDPSDAEYTPAQIFMKWLPVIIICAVVVIAAVVILIVVLSKKGKKVE